MKRLIFLWGLLALLLNGCSILRPGVPVELPQVSRDTVYRTREVHDTVTVTRDFRDTLIQRDSVFVKGETVYKEKYIYKTRTAHDTVTVYRFLRDTMYVHQRDSVSVPVYIDRVQEVKYTPWYKNALAAVGGLCLIAVILWLLFLYLKRKF